MRTAPLLLTTLLITGCHTPSPPHTQIESRTLLRTSGAWDQTPYTHYPQGQPELSLLKIHIPARSTLDWHCHLAPNLGYMLGGAIEVENAAGIRVSLKAGDTLAEIVNGLHRGRTAEEPAEILVFYASAKGIPPFTPAAECPPSSSAE
ncbi:TPA: cupin domain-containing protein [Pseudomonas putida]